MTQPSTPTHNPSPKISSLQPPPATAILQHLQSSLPHPASAPIPVPLPHSWDCQHWEVPREGRAARGFPGDTPPRPGSPGSAPHRPRLHATDSEGVCGPLPHVPAAAALHVFGGGPESRRDPEELPWTLERGGGTGPTGWAGRALGVAGRAEPRLQSAQAGPEHAGRGGAQPCVALSGAGPSGESCRRGPERLLRKLRRA